MGDLTPVELRDGMWYKREDFFADPVWGVNGSKYRTWSTVISGLEEEKIVVAGSVHAPTVPIAAVSALQASKKCTVIVGGTTPEKAQRHRYIQIAVEAGASIEAIGVGYNPALQKASKAFSEANPGTWRLGVPDDPGDLEAFLRVGGAQVANLPDEIETLVIPFGSGNTAAGVLYGLATNGYKGKVLLIGIGPDRQTWLNERLYSVGLRELLFEVEHIGLHGWFAAYGDRMPETSDGIVMHPTYEGKAVRYLNMVKPEWWTRRDGTTCFWIVGGPLD